MKYLLITSEYAPSDGGVANYYKNMVEKWPVDSSIEVLHNNDGKLLSNFIIPKWLPAVFVLLRTIREKKVDHVLVGQILPLGIVAYIVFEILGVSYTIFVHGMDIEFAKKKIRKRWITKKIISRAHGVICASSFTSQIVKNFMKGKCDNKISVVNPGVDEVSVVDNKIVDEIREKYDLSGKMIIFAVSRLVKRKGFDKVIESMDEVQKYVPNAHFYLAGDGPDKDYLKEKIGEQKNVTIIGRPSNEEKWAWMKLCDVFAMPSRSIEGDFEGFGIVYLEAGLMGKPVLAGDSGGVQDAVKPAWSGMIVNPEDIEEIANALITLLKDEDLRSRLGEYGKQRAENEFNWRGQAQKIYNLVK